MRIELESVPKAVVVEKDRMNDSKRRDEQLEYLNDWLADHDAELDIRRLYQR